MKFLNNTIIRDLKTWPLGQHQPAAHLYSSPSMDGFYMIKELFFLKRAKTIKQVTCDRAHMWQVKPRTVATWFFTENVCLLVNRWRNWSSGKFRKVLGIIQLTSGRSEFEIRFYLFPKSAYLALIMLSSCPWKGLSFPVGRLWSKGVTLQAVFALTFLRGWKHTHHTHTQSHVQCCIKNTALPLSSALVILYLYLPRADNLIRPKCLINVFSAGTRMEST